MVTSSRHYPICDHRLFSAHPPHPPGLPNDDVMSKGAVYICGGHFFSGWITYFTPDCLMMMWFAAWSKGPAYICGGQIFPGGINYWTLLQSQAASRLFPDLIFKESIERECVYRILRKPFFNNVIRRRGDILWAADKNVSSWGESEWSVAWKGVSSCQLGGATWGQQQRCFDSLPNICKCKHRKSPKLQEQKFDIRTTSIINPNESKWC